MQFKRAPSRIHVLDASKYQAGLPSMLWRSVKQQPHGTKELDALRKVGTDFARECSLRGKMMGALRHIGDGSQQQWSILEYRRGVGRMAQFHRGPTGCIAVIRSAELECGQCIVRPH